MNADLLAWLRGVHEAADDYNSPNGDGYHALQSQHTMECGYDQLEFSRRCRCGGPAAVLARVAAERRIVDQLLPEVERLDEVWEAEAGPGDDPTAPLLLALLAAGWADQPGYRDEWRPVSDPTSGAPDGVTYMETPSGALIIGPARYREVVVQLASAAHRAAMVPGALFGLPVMTWREPWHGPDDVL